MSVNKYKPHVYVIPEDDADRQIAVGFVMHPRVAARQVQVMEPSGGWARVLDTFKNEYVPLLEQSAHTHVVMIVDFDQDVGKRRAYFEAEIPEELRGRAFVIGPQDTPETLRQALGKRYEEIGQTLARECDNENLEVWNHEQLQHNDRERLRLVESVAPFLFIRD